MRRQGAFSTAINGSISSSTMPDCFRRGGKLTADGYEMTIAVNHLAPFLLTNHPLPALEHSGQPGRNARIVNVASEAANRASIDLGDLMSSRRYSMMAAYGQSKLANILFTKELARRLPPRPVTANCLHPGVVATGIGDKGGVFGFGWSMLKPALLTPEKGAANSLYVATSPAIEGVSGAYFVKQKPGEAEPDRRRSHDCAAPLDRKREADRESPERRRPRRRGLKIRPRANVRSGWGGRERGLDPNCGVSNRREKKENGSSPACRLTSRPARIPHVTRSRRARCALRRRPPEAALPRRHRQHDRNDDRMVRFLPLQHGDGACLRQTVFPGVRSADRHPASVRHLRRGVRARPVGAAIFGHYGDRMGRKAA